MWRGHIAWMGSCLRGLSFDPGTRTISGTPPEFAWYTFDGYTVTYRVADVDGEEPAPLIFTIRVDGIPRFDETVSESSDLCRRADDRSLGVAVGFGWQRRGDV